MSADTTKMATGAAQGLGSLAGGIAGLTQSQPDQVLRPSLQAPRLQQQIPGLPQFQPQPFNFNFAPQGQLGGQDQGLMSLLASLSNMYGGKA